MGMETEFFAEGNEIGWMILCGVSLMFFMGVVLLLFFFFSKKKIAQKELEKKNLELGHQKKLLRATIETQEKERKRIAEDLHDDISSKLNIIFLNCELLSMKNLPENKKKEALRTITGLSSKVLESSRNIAHNLSPPVFNKFGLDAGVEELCAEFNSSHSIKVKYQNHIQFEDAEKDRHLHVLRILQELMNNSLRHGKADNITIQFEKEGSKTICEYKDDGKGFDIENKANKNGLGMKNIESRVGFLKGTMSIDSTINEGIKVNFDF